MSVDSGITARSLDDKWPVGKKSAYFSLFVAFMLGLMDFLDRQVISALFPHLKQEYLLSDTQLGVLIAIVNVAIAVLVIPSGYLIDRWSRKKMLCLMGVVWSLATGACALAGTYAHLVMARFFVGFGEAGYAPASQSLVAASFPKRLRATVISLLQVAPAIGVPLGLVLGALIAERWGWRHAFGIVAVPGLFIALSALFIKDFKSTRETGGAPSASAPRKSYLRELWELVRTPSMLCVYLACISTLLYSTSVMNWLPSYFNRAGMSVTYASTVAAAVMIVGTLCTILAGPFLDFLRRRGPRVVLIYQGLGSLLSFVLCCFIYQVVEPGSKLQFVLLLLQAVPTCTIVPLAFTLVADLSHPERRGTAVGTVITLQNIFGMALGPLVTGILSDHFDLGTALSILAGGYVVVGAAFLIMSLTYQRDVEKVGDVAVEF